jgi:hypothetical protein
MEHPKWPQISEQNANVSTCSHPQSDPALPVSTPVAPRPLFSGHRVTTYSQLRLSLPAGAQAASRIIVPCSSVSRFSTRLTPAPIATFPSVTFWYSVTERLLDGYLSSLEPRSDVGDLLNALIDPPASLPLWPCTSC